MGPMCVQGQLRRAAAWILVAAVAAASAGCSDNDPGLGVTPVQTTRDVFFSSTIQPAGFAWRSFKVERAGKVTVQFVSIAPTADLVMRVSVGTFDGTNCTPTTTVDTPPQATGPQITLENVAAGDYCVQVQDIGNVVQISVFAITILITTSAS
jgi:hypothetical protein